jgi:transcriptional regulator with XRE-family HTH domain
MADPVDATGMGKRLRELMVERGFTQQRLERAIGASSGYLSRIIKGTRGQKISPEYLTSLASALETTPSYLRWGKEVADGSIMTPSAGLSPSLQEIPGYREAEFAAIRNNPDIPFAVFEGARLSRISPPQDHITAEYLSEFVRFLASTMRDETAAVKEPVQKGVRAKTVRR